MAIKNRSREILVNICKGLSQRIVAKQRKIDLEAFFFFFFVAAFRNKGTLLIF